jgi:low molecular weight protein-tyrosine phosphatase
VVTNDRPTAAPERSVLFVCLGNICRSPTVEIVFKSVLEDQGLHQHVFVDSAGTGSWHVGAPPDPRAIQAARRRGYDLTALRARQVEASDFERFGWILAMDNANLRELKSLRPADYSGHLGLFLEFAPELGLREVPDPYFGGRDGFDHVLDIAEKASAALLTHITARLRGGR